MSFARLRATTLVRSCRGPFREGQEPAGESDVRCRAGRTPDHIDPVSADALALVRSPNVGRPRWPSKRGRARKSHANAAHRSSRRWSPVRSGTDTASAHTAARFRLYKDPCMNRRMAVSHPPFTVHLRPSVCNHGVQCVTTAAPRPKSRPAYTLKAVDSQWNVGERSGGMRVAEVVAARRAKMYTLFFPIRM